jgi:NAD kinase
MKKYENRIVIVTRTTRLKQVLESQNTVSQAKFYIKNLGSDFDDYENEHNTYNESVQSVKRSLDDLGNIQMLDRKFLTNFIFAPDDIVVVAGQDGLVVNTLKYLNGQPVIGVNPDTSRWDGVLLPFKPADVHRVLEETILGKRRIEEVSMARARVQNGQELLAVNDFFIGQKTHASSRYVIKYNGLRENQSSSGVIISTGLGSTGWMKSIIAGASRINASIIGRPFGLSQESDGLTEEDMESSAKTADSEVLASPANMAGAAIADMSVDMAAQESEDIPEKSMRSQSRQLKEFAAPDHRMRRESIALSKKKKTFGPSELSGVVGKWSSKELMFAVREPFPSKTTGTNLIFGTVSDRTPLKIESLMGENGVIFSDGIENDFIVFNSGTEVEITLAAKSGKMVV